MCTFTVAPFCACSMSVSGVMIASTTVLPLWVALVTRLTVPGSGISGGAGYVLRKFGYEMAPLLLAFVLRRRRR